MNQRHYLCPALPLGSCDWGGPLEDLHLHFEISHRRLRRKRKAHDKYDQIFINSSINVENNSEENRLLIYQEDMFLLQLKVDFAREKLWAGIRHIGAPESEVKFQYSMLIDSEIRSLKSKKIGVVQLDNDWGFDIQSMLEYDISHVTRAAIKNIQYQLKIYHPEKRTGFVISELICVMCKSSFSPPAYACRKGHLFCANCKRTADQHGHVGSTPCNLMVENISRLLLYPCKNEDLGCYMALSKSKIVSHEERCVTLTSCFAEKKCHFVGTTYNWWYHLHEKHPEAVAVLNEANWYNVRETHCQTIFVRNKTVFRILSERSQADGPFVWSCQQLGLKPGEESAFQLHVTAGDRDSFKSQVVARVNCCPLIQPEDEATEHCSVSVDTLQPFIVDNRVCIRFYVVKAREHI